MVIWVKLKSASTKCTRIGREDQSIKVPVSIASNTMNVHVKWQIWKEFSIANETSSCTTNSTNLILIKYTSIELANVNYSDTINKFQKSSMNSNPRILKETNSSKRQLMSSVLKWGTNLSIFKIIWFLISIWLVRSMSSYWRKEKIPYSSKENRQRQRQTKNNKSTLTC